MSRKRAEFMTEADYDALVAKHKAELDGQRQEFDKMLSLAVRDMERREADLQFQLCTVVESARETSKELDQVRGRLSVLQTSAPLMKLRSYVEGELIGLRPDVDLSMLSTDLRKIASAIATRHITGEIAGCMEIEGDWHYTVRWPSAADPPGLNNVLWHHGDLLPVEMLVLLDQERELGETRGRELARHQAEAEWMRQARPSREGEIVVEGDDGIVRYYPAPIFPAVEPPPNRFTGGGFQFTKEEMEAMVKQLQKAVKLALNTKPITPVLPDDEET